MIYFLNWPSPAYEGFLDRSCLRWLLPQHHGRAQSPSPLAFSSTPSFPGAPALSVPGHPSPRFTPLAQPLLTSSAGAPPAARNWCDRWAEGSVWGWLSLQSCAHELSGNQSKTTSPWSTGQNRAGWWGRHRISLCWVTARGSSNTASRAPAHPLPQAPHPSTPPTHLTHLSASPQALGQPASQGRLDAPRGEGRASGIKVLPCRPH